MKMTSHVCYEFIKDISKCKCLKRRGAQSGTTGSERRSSFSNKDRLMMNENKKPIWMSSGLMFRTSSYNNNMNLNSTSKSGFN